MGSRLGRATVTGAGESVLPYTSHGAGQATAGPRWDGRAGQGSRAQAQRALDSLHIRSSQVSIRDRRAGAAHLGGGVASALAQLCLWSSASTDAAAALPGRTSCTPAVDGAPLCAGGRRRQGPANTCAARRIVVIEHGNEARRPGPAHLAPPRCAGGFAPGTAPAHAYGRRDQYARAAASIPLGFAHGAGLRAIRLRAKPRVAGAAAAVVHIKH